MTTVITGDVVKSKHALTGAWRTWTPTWTAEIQNPVLGNGTLVGTYKQVDKTVFFNLVLTGGSDTAWGIGFWHFTLPVTAAAEFAASASLRDTSADTNYTGVADCLTTSMSIGSRTTTTSATVPFTWADTDVFKIHGVYQAA